MQWLELSENLREDWHETDPEIHKKNASELKRRLWVRADEIELIYHEGAGDKMRFVLRSGVVFDTEMTREDVQDFLSMEHGVLPWKRGHKARVTPSLSKLGSTYLRIILERLKKTTGLQAELIEDDDLTEKEKS